VEVGGKRNLKDFAELAISFEIPVGIVYDKDSSGFKSEDEETEYNGILYRLETDDGSVSVWQIDRKHEDAARRAVGEKKYRSCRSKAAAGVLGEPITIINASNPGELDAALAKSQLDAAALLVGADPFFNSQRQRIVDLVASLGVPAIYEWREFVDAGGLMSYGPSLADGYRQVGVYVGRILKGEKPADLPVIQPTRFELVINMKTAKALGLMVPAILLAQADEAIE
jgi:hypothetical protein